MSIQSKHPHNTCSRCSRDFICQPDNIAHCDCNVIPLSLEETRFISAQFRDCVCNACLLELKTIYNQSPKPKAIFCWSGGKDSAYALYKVIVENLYDVRYLLTTVNRTLGRVSMHGVREELLHAQAEALGFPLLKVEVSEGSNEEYERQMQAVLLQANAEGIEQVIFGDIFLQDLRAYREANLARVNMKAVFPLWKADTVEQLHRFIDKEFKTIICCTNDAYLGKAWLGREIDLSFVNDLPHGIDPCGEHGEYHSFCYDGPVFRKAIPVVTGEIVYKPLDLKLSASSSPAGAPVTKGFWFIDLLLKT